MYGSNIIDFRGFDLILNFPDVSFVETNLNQGLILYFNVSLLSSLGLLFRFRVDVSSLSVIRPRYIFSFDPGASDPLAKELARI